VKSVKRVTIPNGRNKDFRPAIKVNNMSNVTEILRECLRKGNYRIEVDTKNPEFPEKIIFDNGKFQIEFVIDVFGWKQARE